ncbi:MAG: hypothetical protein SH820_17975 [Xanthomonadales bacterium]|nr:hypothetical protein [Xanthomonadales bacterium]
MSHQCRFANALSRVFAVPCLLALVQSLALGLLLGLAGANISHAQEVMVPAAATESIAGLKVEVPIALPEILPAELVAELPDNRELAASLADLDSRQDTLLSLTALAYLLKLNPTPELGQEDSLVTSFRDSRTWLDRLAGRFHRLPSRSTVLDPAVQVLQQELWQHRILPTPAVAALGPDYPDLLPMLFDRDEERIAASFLPEAVFRVEHNASRIWLEATTLAANSPVLAVALTQLSPEWFEPWTAAEPPARSGEADTPADLDAHFLSLRVLLDSLTLSEPPDQLRFKRLVFDLHRALPELQGAETRSAQQLLRLVVAVDGLYAGQYLEFSQSLLWIAADMLDIRAREEASDTRLAALLAAFLPRISTYLARSFSEVDPRINANLAAVFDVAQALQSGEPVTERLEGLQQELGDAIAQLVLLAPDMAFYFDQPVRRQIREEIDICISLMADRDPEGRLNLSREQFDGCMSGMLDFANTLLRSAELSGDQNGPFAVDQLARELELLPAQRINYLLGYLYEQAPTTCPALAQPLPNPLDWSILSAMMAWFSLQAPVFMQTPANEARIHRMQEIGVNLMQVMSQQLDCLSGSAAGRSDPVSQVLAEYRAALESLVGGIREAELEFREMRLQSGADVVLSGNANQKTAYRTDGLVIGPCELESSCEMTQPLEATRALIGLFPDAYLLADQTGMGQLEICYDHTAWVERRAESVRPEDPNVANYFGRLSFELKGRYREGDQSRDIFGSTFVSPEEHNYLIAAASDEVLQDECPMEWVGSRIVTTRNDQQGFHIVPNRLTYLAASRSRPSELMTANWSKGEEWRDRFITGHGVSPIEFEADKGIYDRLGQHLRTLYQAEQQAIYGGMLRSTQSDNIEDFRMLNALLNRVTTFKALLQAELVLFYPETMLDSDDIRAMLEGQGGLLDENIIRRFRASNAAISEIHQAGLTRLDRFQALWKQQPEAVVRSGSVPVSLAHAMARLNYIDQLYFASPAESQRAVANAAAEGVVATQTATEED